MTRRRIPLPTASLPSRGAMVDQPRGFDLLSLPGLRRFLRWRYARLVFQIPLLILALLVIVDGLTGRQIASRNVGTTAVWLHYRGLVVIALAVIGNAFCAGCPLMLTRGPSKALKRLLPSEFRWPKALRSKWLVAGLLLAFFLTYEIFDLWASPWLTAWLAIGYFAAALSVDTLFPAGTFCRYLCPLGNFNFAFSSVSLTQVAAADPEVCRSCEHKPCLHGRETYENPIRAKGDAAFIPLDEIVNANGVGTFPGCESNLYVPTMTSTMDCTSCMNCVRACPHDNVALVTRAPGRELGRDAWRKRWGFPLIITGVLLLFWGLMNAMAMVPPFYDAAEWLSDVLGSRNEALLVTLMFTAVTLAGLALATGGAVLADLAGGAGFAPKRALMRWGYVFVALGFGFWAAHYLFHFLTGALQIVPVTQHFFEYRGAAIDPNWRLAQVVPSRWLFPIGALLSSGYGLLAAYLTIRIALRDFGRRGVLAMWPMLALVLGLVAFQVVILSLPMEMRGTVLGPLGG